MQKQTPTSTCFYCGSIFCLCMWKPERI